MSKRLQIWATLLTVLAGSFLVSAQVTIPYNFTAGTTIDPDQMNSNFSAVGNGALNRTGGTLTGGLNLNGQTLSGSTTATGAWTFSSAGTGINVSNNAVIGGTASIGGTLGVGGVATFTAKPVLNAGLQFSASPVFDADANALYDYKRGQWTPRIGGSGGTSAQTYTTQVGYFEKIGKTVYVEGYVVLSAKGTITGSVQIQGLPYTAQNTPGLFGGLHIEHFGTATNWIYISAEVQPNTTAATLFGATAATTSLASPVDADIANATQFVITGRYFAES